jgi:hypothetical protein
MNFSQIILSRTLFHDVTPFHTGLHSNFARRYPQGYILDCAIRPLLRVNDNVPLGVQ